MRPTLFELRHIIISTIESCLKRKYSSFIMHSRLSVSHVTSLRIKEQKKKGEGENLKPQ